MQICQIDIAIKIILTTLPIIFGYFIALHITKPSKKNVEQKEDTGLAEVIYIYTSKNKVKPLKCRFGIHNNQIVFSRFADKGLELEYECILCGKSSKCLKFK